jgi:hypothetical protein
MSPGSCLPALDRRLRGRAAQAVVQAFCDDLGLTWTRRSSGFLDASNRRGTGLTPRRLAPEQPQRCRRRLGPEQQQAVAEVLSRFRLDLWSQEATA